MFGKLQHGWEGDIIANCCAELWIRVRGCFANRSIDVAGRWVLFAQTVSASAVALAVAVEDVVVAASLRKGR